MTKQRRSISEADWPIEDLGRWRAARLRGDVIDPDGKAGHWEPTTLRQVAKGYGLWLGYLAEQGLLNIAVSPEQRLTREILRSYIGELELRQLASTTIASRITDLYEALRVMAPEADLSSLRRTKDRLRQVQYPRRNKQVRIMPSSELLKVATEYLASVASLPCQNERMRASWFRDGLMVLLLASRPMRLRNLTAIEIDRHLLRQGSVYTLSFLADETKEHRPICFPCPPEFTPWLEQYLQVHRPLLSRGPQTSRLWLSIRGGPASGQTIYIAVCKLTEQLTGRPIHPHLFRDCLVSEMAEQAPDRLPAASRILGHSSLSLTNKHYNQAQMLASIKAHQKALEETFEELRISP
jgi:integrase/recombinase XerD